MVKPILTKLAAEAGLVNSIQKPNCFVFRLFLAPELEAVHVGRIHDGAKELQKPSFYSRWAPAPNTSAMTQVFVRAQSFIEQWEAHKGSDTDHFW